MNDIKKSAKSWIDQNVWDGEDRIGSGDRAVISPDSLWELVNDLIDDIFQDQSTDLSWKDGELPPIGSHLEYTFGAKVEWHESVILPDKRIAYKVSSGRWLTGLIDDSADFRPIKSDRERFIEAGICVWQSKCKHLDKFEATTDLGELFDAGFKAPEDK